MREQEIADPIDYLLNNEISAVLSKGFYELYERKPDFPVTHLANWLKEYSKGRHDKKCKEIIVSNHQKEQQAMMYKIQEKLDADKKEVQQKQNAVVQSDAEFLQKIGTTKYLEDMYEEWLPNYIERRYELTGCYVGIYKHPFKELEVNNFEPGAEIDTDSPKIIEYIGWSDSQKPIMFKRILPSESGVSYAVLDEAEPEPEPEQGEQEVAAKPPKKEYLYVPDVTKNDKVYYFKFPKLGAYACFPLKIKSHLFVRALDSGINTYREYLANKEETEKEYQEKLADVRIECEEASKKYEDCEVPEEQPNPDAETQKSALREKMEESQAALKELETNPPKVEDAQFQVVQKAYIIGCDTLGKDQRLSEEVLSGIESKILSLKKKAEQNERRMLLQDILKLIEEENRIEQQESMYREFEKQATLSAEQTGKEKSSREKEQEFEISYAKCKKMEEVFKESFLEKSMATYFSYNVPKYSEVLQITFMLIGYPKQDINYQKTNTFNFRKVYQEEFLELFWKRLKDYDLRPEEAEQCNPQYKINVFIERMEKIDAEAVLRYNLFIWALLQHAKMMCWTRIQCRDAQVETHELNLKAKEQRDQQIVKYKEELDKSLEAYKADLGESAEEFDEEEWISKYKQDNPQPQQYEVPEPKKTLDIE